MSDNVTIRELAPEEFERVEREVPFFKESGFSTPDPRNTRILIGEDDRGKIVAFWFAFTAVHVEPLWIAPAHRKRAGVLRKLWASMAGLLRTTGSNVAFGIVSDMDLPTHAPLAHKLGFMKVPGSLYMIHTPSMDNFARTTPPVDATEEALVG